MTITAYQNWIPNGHYFVFIIVASSSTSVSISLR